MTIPVMIAGAVLIFLFGAFMGLLIAGLCNAAVDIENE